MSAAYQMGLRLSSQGRHAEAIAQFEQALAQAPGDTKVLFALGNTAGQLGLDEVAEQFYRQVLALEPMRAEAIVNLANLSAEEEEIAFAAQRKIEYPGVL